MVSISYKFITFRVIIDVLFVIYVINCWNWESFNNTMMIWSCKIFFWIFELVTLILVLVWGWAFEFDSWHSNLTSWNLFWVDSSWCHLVLWEIFFIAGFPIKRNWHFLISVLGDWFALNFGRLDKLGFIGRNTFKFNLRRSEILTRRFFKFLFSVIKLFWVCSWLDRIWLKLVFIGATTNKRNLVHNFTLS